MRRSAEGRAKTALERTLCKECVRGGSHRTKFAHGRYKRLPSEARQEERNPNCPMETVEDDDLQAFSLKRCLFWECLANGCYAHKQPVHRIDTPLVLDVLETLGFGAGCRGFATLACRGGIETPESRQDDKELV